MKVAQVLTLVAAVIAGIGQTQAAEPTSQPAVKKVEAPAERAKPADKLAAIARQIESAVDPLAAIGAYARGYAIDPNSLALHKAYMARMLRADLAPVAYDSARVVAAAEPKNTRAWTVLAHKHIRSKELTLALATIARAAPGLADDPFGQRVAGEIFGGYDRGGGKGDIPESLSVSLKRIRKDLADKKAFTDAYAAATAEKSAVKPAQRKAPPAKPAAAKSYAPTVTPRELAERAKAIADKLDRQAKDLSGALRGAGAGRSRSAAPSRGNYYRYESYGPGYYRGGGLGGYGGYGGLYLNSPYYGYYPYVYRIRGSVTHGKPFRGMGGHSFWRDGGWYGSITHGRRFRNMR